MADGTKSGPYRPELNSAAVMTFAVVLVLVAPLVVWLVAALMTPTPSHRSNRTAQGNCATAVVRELAAYGNFSLDPCNDFGHFACYNRDAMAARDVRRDRFIKAVVNPTLQGTLKSNASMLLATLYRRCMKRMANDPATPEKVVITAFETVRSWGTLDGDSNGSLSVVSIVATMDIRGKALLPFMGVYMEFPDDQFSHHGRPKHHGPESYRVQNYNFWPKLMQR